MLLCCSKLFAVFFMEQCLGCWLFAL